MDAALENEKQARLAIRELETKKYGTHVITGADFPLLADNIPRALKIEHHAFSKNAGDSAIIYHNGIRAKQYYHRYITDKYKYTAKALPRSIGTDFIDRQKEFSDCVHGKHIEPIEITTFTKRHHHVYITETTKKIFDCFDNKSYQTSDLESFYPYGYF